ncbi:MAG: GAF domain-containing protein [Anaerolineae bacterium]|nr:GAF domain-containing protein [Anaerolineae bacterium]
MWQSLRLRLTIIFIGLAVVPVMIVGLFLAQRGFAAEQEQALDLQRQVAQRVSAELDAYLQGVETNLQSIGDELRGLEQPDRAQQLSILLNALNTGTYRNLYEGLILLDRDGHEHLHVTRNEIVNSDVVVDRSAAPEFTQPSSTRETYVAHAYYDEATSQALVTIAIPMYRLRSVELSGVLVADVRLNAIRNMLAGLQVGDNQMVYVADEDGHVVARRDVPVAAEEASPAFSSVDGRGTGLDGTDVLFATDNVEFGGHTFTAVAERSVDDALESAQNGLQVSGMVTALALLAAGALVFVTVRQVVRPIERLSRTAQDIRDGNLEARAAVTSQDEIGTLAQSFNDMTARLQEMIIYLEDLVEERVRDLALASDVSRQITTELDFTKLLSEVADLTTTSFDLYHTSIFLFDDDDQTITLRQGTGEVGEQMVAGGKQFRLSDQGLVPQAARDRQIALSNDVLANPHHFKNPLLPETRSELALPMMYGNQLVGVLDLQSQTVGRFDDEDVKIMTTLAEQIAIAVRNAALFEEVERVSKVKSAFLASMSHELRTPLNAIINFTKYVAKGSAGPVNDEQRESLNEVIDSGKHLLNLINDVLDMSKIESGSLNLFVEDNVDLKPVIQAVAATGRTLLQDKPVTVQVDVPNSLPLVKADRQRILQVLLNVMSNACKFTEDGSITLRVNQGDDEIIFAVQDTGAGIAPQDQQAVFEAFKQTETGLRQGGGTGLGMPISKSLIEAHGGRIWLESELGKGTTFYITLPVNSTVLEPSLIT